MRMWLRKGHRQIGVVAMLAIVAVTGTGWALMRFSGWGGYDFRHMAAGHGVILAGGTQGLFRSEDGGGRWEEVTMPASTLPVVAMAEHRGRFAVGFRGMGLWQSEDGFVWERANAPEGETVVAISGSDAGWVVLTDRALHQGGKRIPYAPSIIRRIHDWHTGWALGRVGVLVVELTAIALLLLSITGLLLVVAV